jgi:hypothetical protein
MTITALKNRLNPCHNLRKEKIMRKNIMQLLSVTALTTPSLSVWGDTIYKGKNQQGTTCVYQRLNSLRIGMSFTFDLLAT